jgi:hypothetical protein
MLHRAGAMAAIDPDAVHPTLKSAMNAFLALQSGPPTVAPDAGDAADASGESV